MDELIANWGYWGLLLGSFIAGSLIPFSSEVLITGCLALGMDPILLIVVASIGNIAGGMTCFAMGYLGTPEWVQRVFHLSDKKMAQARRFISTKGAWMAFFSFVPFLGCAIVVTLGLMRSRISIVLLSMSVGKILRYIVWVLGFIGVLTIFR